MSTASQSTDIESPLTAPPVGSLLPGVRLPVDCQAIAYESLSAATANTTPKPMLTPNQQDGPFNHFECLPAELIEKVLRSLLVRDKPIKVQWPVSISSSNPIDPILVLTVCRRFHQLGTPILYTNHIIEFRQDPRSYSFPQELQQRAGVEKAALIKHVTLTVDIDHDLRRYLDGDDPLLKHGIQTNQHRYVYRKILENATETNHNLEKQLQTFDAGLTLDVISCFPSLQEFEVASVGRPWVPTTAQHFVIMGMVNEGSIGLRFLRSHARWRTPGNSLAPGRVF